MISKRWLLIGAAGSLFAVGIPIAQCIVDGLLNNFVRFTTASAIAQVEGSSESDAQKFDEPEELTPEESAAVQRYRDSRVRVDSAIAKYFNSKPSEHKGGSDGWYYNGRYLRHVVNVYPREIMSPDTTLPLNERTQVGEIGVWVDKEENVGEVERQLPNQLDGVPVEVYPKFTPEERAERQRLRDLQAPVEAAIAKYFSSKPSERKDGLDRWYFKGRYLRHVLSVSGKAIFSPDTTLQPKERFQGDDIGVEVDDTDGAVDEVERELPPILDGIRVEVWPAPTDAELN